jgi:hypothetical protein
MRNLLLIVSIGAAACGAARAPRTTLPREYMCGDADVVPHADRLEVREANASVGDAMSAPAKLGWQDGSGSHSVVGPRSPIDVAAVEFVVPEDGSADAVKNLWDTSRGTSTADWRLVRREVCTLRGGDSDVLARYARGATLDDIAKELSLSDRDAAREALHRAMLQLQRRYFADR